MGEIGELIGVSRSGCGVLVVVLMGVLAVLVCVFGMLLLM